MRYDTLRNFGSTQHSKEEMHKHVHMRCILDLTNTNNINIAKRSYSLSEQFSNTFKSMICNNSVSQRDIIKKLIFKDGDTEIFNHTYISTSLFPSNSSKELVRHAKFICIAEFITNTIQSAGVESQSSRS